MEAQEQQKGNKTSDNGSDGRVVVKAVLVGKMI